MPRLWGLSALGTVRVYCGDKTTPAVTPASIPCLEPSSGSFADLSEWGVELGHSIAGGIREDEGNCN